MPLSGKEVVKLLKRNGWNLSRVKGSHHIMTKGRETIPVPVHGNKALGRGLEKTILKQAGVERK